MATVCNAVQRTLNREPILKGERVLLLDYDGTLAPHVADRDGAYPYPEVPRLLDEIARCCDTRVVIITGREASDIPNLLKTSERLEIWGCHGLDHLKADGTYRTASLSRPVENGLAAAAEKLTAAGLRGLMETKRGCIAVHWRGLTPSYMHVVKGAAYQIFSRFLRVPGLSIQDFDEGVELRATECNKGQVVQKVLAESSPNASIAYLGDDTTDEDAFRALNGRGLTILVRPTYRFTAAKFWLRPPEDIVWFLRAWIKGCKGEQ